MGGKILIGRSTAGEIRANFLRRGLHQSLEIWLGKSKEKLHEFFEIARHQAPAVLVIGNSDALAADRKDLRSSVGHMLINQALAELNRETPKNKSVLVIGATNAPWHLDSASLRSGRFEHLIFVPLAAAGQPFPRLSSFRLCFRSSSGVMGDIMACFRVVVVRDMTQKLYIVILDLWLLIWANCDEGNERTQQSLKDGYCSRAFST